MSTYTEDHLVEQPAIQLMHHELGWDFVNCWDKWSGGVSDLGRDGKREIDKLLKGGVKVSFPDTENGGQRRVLFQSNPTGGCNALKNKVFLFKWKTSA